MPASGKAATACPFCWYELTTSDAQAASKFYTSVIGWTAQQANPEYTLMLAGQRMVAGVMGINDEMKARGVPPCWTGYIAVPDCDAFVAKVTAAGGKLHRAPCDIPDVGRFAVVSDPHGGGFVLFTPSGTDPNPPAAPDTPGLVGWRELYAGNLDEAFAFYSKLFGWTKSTAVDMGPMGIYQLFAIDGVDAGGMMTKPSHVPMVGWNYYINVEAIDAALTRVTSAGGKTVNGPMEVPGGSWVAVCIDPQGAPFSMSAPRR